VPKKKGLKPQRTLGAIFPIDPSLGWDYNGLIMKLMTFNVNSLKMRLPIVLDLLATHAPDVMMLQEIKGTEVPENELRQAGYHVQAVTQKAYNGVATLTRAPATGMVTRLPGMEDDDQARYVVVDAGGVRVINIYAPNGNPVGADKYTYKLRWLRALYDELARVRAAGIDAVVAGDFNIIPEPIDAARPGDWQGDALFQDEVRGIYRAILYLGFIDAVRAAAPSSPDGDYTFWDYQAGAWPRNNGIRIDHVLLTPRLADRLGAVMIDRAPRALEKPSDHTPVVVELRS
jgi:exodeoxyribonuclease III